MSSSARKTFALILWGGDKSLQAADIAKALEAAGEGGMNMKRRRGSGQEFPYPDAITAYVQAAFEDGASRIITMQWASSRESCA